MDATSNNDYFVKSNLERVHVRLQQRNGRKFISTISGIATDLDIKLLLKHFKRNFNCTGSIVLDSNGNEATNCYFITIPNHMEHRKTSFFIYN